VNTSWRIAGTDDFEGDGVDSILWRDTDGDTELWNPNGSGGFTYDNLGAVNTSWQIAGTGDFTGDGQSGILAQRQWRYGVMESQRLGRLHIPESERRQHELVCLQNLRLRAFGVTYRQETSVLCRIEAFAVRFCDYEPRRTRQAVIGVTSQSWRMR
jgi:hypothetical protein